MKRSVVKKQAEPTTNEIKLAILETKVDQLMEDGLRREEKQDEFGDKLEEIKMAIAAINEEASRYKGFIGGVVLVITGVGICLKWALPIWQWLFKAKGAP